MAVVNELLNVGGIVIVVAQSENDSIDQNHGDNYRKQDLSLRDEISNSRSKPIVHPASSFVMTLTVLYHSDINW